MQAQTLTKKEIAAQKRTARAAELAERKAEAERQAAALQQARQRALAFSKKPPAEFQSWGVIKTRLWRTMADRCRKLGSSTSKRQDSEQVNQAADLIAAMWSWSAEQCANYLDSLRIGKAAAKTKWKTK